MRFSSEYVIEAQRLTQRIALELRPERCEALRLIARALGRAAWIDEMKRVRDESAVLVTLEPSMWQHHPAWRQEKSKYLHLCCMLICALQGTALLELLASRGHFLTNEKAYRTTLAYASEFVRDLDEYLHDPWWPLGESPFVD